MQSVDSKKCKKKLSAPFCSIGREGTKTEEKCKELSESSRGRGQFLKAPKPRLTKSGVLSA
jgi:hypothetical protein